MSGSFSTYALEAFLFLGATAVAVLYILGFFHKTTDSAAHHSGSPSIPTSFTCTSCDGPYETLEYCDARSPGTCGCEDGYHRDSRDNSCIPTPQVSNIACPPYESTQCGLQDGPPKYFDIDQTPNKCVSCPVPVPDSGSYIADCTGCNSGRSVECAGIGGCLANQYRTGCGNTVPYSGIDQNYSPGTCTDCAPCASNTEVRVNCSGINPGECVCAAGYGGNAATNTCETCPPGYYKPDAGDEECIECETCPPNQNMREEYRSGCGNTQPGSCETCQGCEEPGHYRQGCGRFSELDANVAGTCTMCTLFQPGNDPVGNYRRFCGDDTPTSYNNEGTVTACSGSNAATCPAGQVRTGCGCTLDIGKTELVSSVPTAIPYPTIMNSNGSPTSLATCVQKCRMFNTSNTYILNVTSDGTCKQGNYAKTGINEWTNVTDNTYTITTQPGTASLECGQIGGSRTPETNFSYGTYETECNAVNYADNVCSLMNVDSNTFVTAANTLPIRGVVQDVPACDSSGATPTQYLYNNNCYTCGNVAVSNTATSSDAPYEYMTSPGICAVEKTPNSCSSPDVSLGYSGYSPICSNCCTLSAEFCNIARGGGQCTYSHDLKQCQPSSATRAVHPRGFCNTCLPDKPVLLNGNCNSCCSLTEAECNANNGISCTYNNTLNTCLPNANSNNALGLGFCNGCSPTNPAKRNGNCVTCCSIRDGTACNDTQGNCRWSGNNNECVTALQPAYNGGTCGGGYGFDPDCGDQTIQSVCEAKYCYWTATTGSYSCPNLHTQAPAPPPAAPTPTIYYQNPISGCSGWTCSAAEAGNYCPRQNGVTSGSSSVNWLCCNGIWAPAPDPDSGFGSASVSIGCGNFFVPPGQATRQYIPPPIDSCPGTRHCKDGSDTAQPRGTWCKQGAGYTCCPHTDGLDYWESGWSKTSCGFQR